MNHSLDHFFGIGNELDPANLDPSLRALLDAWQATIRGGGIGFLPRRRQQRIYWYAFAPSARQRRELLGLLDAWVGPTYSDIATGRGELDVSDAFDAAFAEPDVVPLRFEVLPRVGPQSGSAKTEVRNALRTLTKLVNNRLPSQFDAMRTTVEILDDLGHAVAARDRTLAEACITELDQSADLDKSNVAFLRFRLYAGMRDWAAMFADPALEHVLSMRRPLGITRVIQSGLYYQRLEKFDRHGAESDLRTASETLEPWLRGLYTGAPPSNRAEAVIELLCRLLATRSVTDSAVVDLIGIASGIEPGLDEHFTRIVESFVPGETPYGPRTEASTEKPLDLTMELASLTYHGEFAACIERGVASEPSVESGRVLVHAARQLSSAKWAAMVVDYLVVHGLMEDVAVTTPVLRADVQWLESVCGESSLRGWADWIASLDGPDAAPVQLLNEAAQSWEPLPDVEFVGLLTHASEATLAKLGENGGPFLAAHANLLEAPDAVDVTLRLLAAMALSGKASAGVRVQTLALCESLSTVGPPQSTFEEIIEWTAEILDENTAATTVSWVCDVVQTLTSIPASGSTEPVLGFYYRALEALRPYRSALDTIDLEALEVVAAELGTQISPEFRATRADIDGDDPTAAYRYLEEKTVILHSLTESAITRASQVLKRLVPTVDVRTNSEHDGSTQLAQLSTNADLFVVVTASAKHAATTFINHHRPHGLPTVLVNSRGSTAILRELANFSGKLP